MCEVCDTPIEIENKLFAGLTSRLNAFVDKLAEIGSQKKRFSKDYMKAVADFLLGGVEKQPSVGAAYNVVNMAKQSYMEANVFRFSCAKTVSVVNDLNKILRIQKKSSDFREFKKKVDELKLNYNKHWLETEYQLTQSISRNSVRHSQFMNELDVFQFVKYKTIADERVRDWHKVLHNKIVKINSAEYDLIFPPNGYRCRCEFVQVTPTVDDMNNLVSERDVVTMLSAEKITSTQSAYEYMKANGFDRNRAKSGVIFDENRMYINSFNESGINYKDYDLENYQQFKNANPNIRNVGEETANFKYDYRGYLIDTQFSLYQDDTLNVPDEVWLTYDEQNDIYQKKYIRQNEVITIELTSHNERIVGVDRLADATIDKIRKGVLIHGN